VRILYISQRVPYPPVRGDKITTWRGISHLAKKHEVTIVAFAHNAGDLEAAETLRQKGFTIHTVDLDMKRNKLRSLPFLLGKKPLTLGVYGSAELQRVVDREIENCDLAFSYSSSMGAFLLPHPHKPRVQFVCELDSDKWAQYAGFTKFPMSWIYKREARTLLEFEREMCGAMDMNMVVTPVELAIFEERIPGAPCRVQRNGVDLEHFNPSYNAPEPGHMVFTGVMDYFPNVDGCVWFAREILPEIRRRHPEARFSVVGSSPSKEILSLASLPGVEVTGFVDETRDWLARAQLGVAPLRIARGIQNKVLEAMGMGLPVVGTTNATQGVEGVPGRDFLVADDVASQVEACCRLIANPEEGLALGRQARAFVEESYSWETVLEPMTLLLEDIVRARGGDPS